VGKATARMGLNFITAILYIALAVIAWRSVAVVRQGTSDVPDAPMIAAFRWGVLVTLAVHAASLLADMFGKTGVNLSFANAASLVAWITLSIYTVSSVFDRRLTPLQMGMIGPAFIAVLLPVIASAPHMLPYGRDPLFLSHFVAAMLAYSLFVVSLLHACLMIFAQTQLHRAAVPWLLKLLPPLQQMERVLFRVLLAAFVLLTGALALGALFSKEMFGVPFRINNHKNVFAIAAWLIFGGILVGHWLAGVRGRIAARWTIAGFMFLLLSYFGSKFVLEIVLGRTF
jgi:ABC-type uncharacterized transport system permease subunit